MEPTITSIAVLPREQAVLTPPESLEDFADHTEGWVYLEEETAHYSRERGQTGLVLRHHRSEEPRELTFLFIARDGHHGAYHLSLVAPASGEPSELTPRSRQRALEAFADAFGSYLQGRREPLRLDVTRAGERTPAATQ